MRCGWHQLKQRDDEEEEEDLQAAGSKYTALGVEMVRTLEKEYVCRQKYSENSGQGRNTEGLTGQERPLHPWLVLQRFWQG